MAVILEFKMDVKTLLAIERKWKECQPFYEKHYQVKFKKMPKPKDVQFLWIQMNKLQESLHEHQKEARRYLEGLRVMWGHEKKPRV